MSKLVAWPSDEEINPHPLKRLGMVWWSRGGGGKGLEVSAYLVKLIKADAEFTDIVSCYSAYYDLFHLSIYNLRTRVRVA